MKINTTRFGEVEFPEETIINFPEGLPGFSGKRYIVLQREETPMIEWLQSVDEPDIAVMLVDPVELLIDYQPKPKSAELQTIQAEGDQLIHRVIIRNGDTPGQLFMNLFAPIMINVPKSLAMQVPLVGSGYSVREVWPPSNAS